MRKTRLQLRREAKLGKTEKKRRISGMKKVSMHKKEKKK